jgi:hypothetical protein
MGFNSFVAKHDVFLGVSGVKVATGEVIEYDGAVVSFKGGKYPEPSVVAAIKLGWFVPKDQYKGTVVKSSAPVSNPFKVEHIDSEEQIVSTVEDYAKKHNSNFDKAIKPEVTAEVNPLDKVSMGKNLEFNPTVVRDIDSIVPMSGDIIATLENAIPTHQTFSSDNMGVLPSTETPVKSAYVPDRPDIKAIKEIQAAKEVEQFQWDMSGHWKQRVKAALEFKDSDKFAKILSMETETVVKHINKALDK